MIVISVAWFQKYYVIFKLLLNYWRATTHFSIIILTLKSYGLINFIA